MFLMHRPVQRHVRAANDTRFATARERQTMNCPGSVADDVMQGWPSLSSVSVSRRAGLCYGWLMKPSLALDLKRSAIREVAGRFRTANPRIFGSVLRGTDHDGSDLDLLVDALPGATLFDLGGLQIELEELLGVRVDVLTPADLPPKLRVQVLAEAQPV